MTENNAQQNYVEKLEQEIIRLKEEVETYRISNSVRGDNLATLKDRITTLLKEFTNE